ncbi:MAG: LuxR C-terminal-related transcriptional regulator [Arenicella sp.]
MDCPGSTKPEISDRLNISFHTVDFHIRNSIRKSGSKNIAAAVATAVRKRLIHL